MITSINVTATDPTQTGEYALATLGPDQAALIPNVGDVVAGPTFSLQITYRIFRFSATSVTVQLETKAG